MKLYLTIALVALLFTSGIAKNVPKNLKTSASEEVVVQETSAESDVLDNVVDNENSLVHNGETVSNTVNLLNTHNVPEVTLLENAQTKTLSPSANLVSSSLKTFLQPVQTVPVQTVNLVKSPASLQTVQTVPVQTLNVYKGQTSQQQNVARAPVSTSKTVLVNQVPSQNVYTVPQTQTVRVWQPQLVSVPEQQQQQVTYSVQQQPQSQVAWSVQQQPQSQVAWSVQQQPQSQVAWSQGTQQQPQSQVAWSVQQQPQSQVTYSVQQPQNQLVWSQGQQQLVSHNTQQVVSVPQSQVTYSVQQPQNQQVLYTQTQPQNQLVSVQQNTEKLVSVPQQGQQNLVLLRSRQQPSTGTTRRQTTNLWVDQAPTVSRTSNLQLVQPVTLTKTVTARAPNPLVYQLTPSRSRGQTVLTGTQLVSDVADESRASDVLSQEPESNY